MRALLLRPPPGPGAPPNLPLPGARAGFAFALVAPPPHVLFTGCFFSNLSFGSLCHYRSRSSIFTALTAVLQGFVPFACGFNSPTMLCPTRALPSPFLRLPFSLSSTPPLPSPPYPRAIGFRRPSWGSHRLPGSLDLSLWPVSSCAPSLRGYACPSPQSSSARLSLRSLLGGLPVLRFLPFGVFPLPALLFLLALGPCGSPLVCGSCSASARSTAALSAAFARFSLFPLSLLLFSPFPRYFPPHVVFFLSTRLHAFFLSLFASALDAVAPPVLWVL